MEERDQHHKPKPGIEEALHPEIGNGSMWETDPHFFSLMVPDPTIILNEILLEDNLRETILIQWSNQFDNLTAFPEEPSRSEDDFEIGEIKKGKSGRKKKNKKILASARPRGPKPDWLEHADEELILKEDPHGPNEGDEPSAGGSEREGTQDKPIKIEGKRFRKAVKKAKKEVEKKKVTEKGPTASPMESTLSPFTRWLKSLKGSEYVHPYEDDYGLDQLPSSTRDGISETFADLLAAQGFRDQAIDMYRLLMAKYPEKSSFFAAKIETLI